MASMLTSMLAFVMHLPGFFA